MSNPLITVMAIAVAAAITAGLLLLAGVGDEDSQSRREAEARQQRIDTTAQQLAADIVQEVPEVCDEVLGAEDSATRSSESSVAVAVDESYFAGFTDRELDALAARFKEELRERCPGGGR